MRCDNKKNNGNHSEDGIFDTEILNELAGKAVCKPNIGLCKNCIKLYYGKSYEELKWGEINGYNMEKSD